MKRLEAQALNAPGIAHGFFGREGGVSHGIYASLNCGPGSKDDPGAVAENRRRVAAALAPEVRLVSLSQVHSPIVHTLARLGQRGRQTPGRRWHGHRHTRAWRLGILTADCAPVLFADAKAGVIGAAHAGWKGALGGVLEATLEAMEKLGASRGASAPPSAPPSARRITKWARIFATAFWKPGRSIAASSCPRTGRGISASTCPAMRPIA